MAPILVAAPFYFSSAMTLGELMMVVGAFNQVQGSLRWFVSNFAVIANWRATLLRVAGFHRALVAAAEGDRSAAPCRIDRREEGGRIEIDGLCLRTPYGGLRLDPGRIVVEPGERMLLQGGSGSGKTMLFRALAGLSDRGEGRLVLPEARRVMYLPTRAYVPPGLLGEALCYPLPSGNYDRPAMDAALRAVGLEGFVARLGTEDRWDRLLGESDKQCLAFARVLLREPDWLVADDALAQLDPEARERVVALLKGRLAGMGILGIGNGDEPPGLFARHARIVTLPGTAERPGPRSDGPEGRAFEPEPV